MKSLVILSLLALAAAITCGKLNTLTNAKCVGFDQEDLMKCLAEFEAGLSSGKDKPLKDAHIQAKCFSLARLRKCLVNSMTKHGCGDRNNQRLEWLMKDMASMLFKDVEEGQCYDYGCNAPLVVDSQGHKIHLIEYSSGERRN